MKLSLVIPVYNAAETINDCLEHLKNQERLPEEIILVDNGSVDKSVQMIKEFIGQHKEMNIILEHEVKKGPAAARNKGLKQATGDIIVFTDSDCLPRKDWIKNLVHLYETSQADAIGGLAYIHNPNTALEKLQAIGAIFSKSIIGKIMENDYEIFFGVMLATCNASFRRAVSDKIGGFDEGITIAAGEDTDFTVRAFKNNFKILVFHPDLVVEHIPRKKIKLLLKQVFQYRMVLPFLLKKHFNSRIFIEIPRFGIKVLPSSIPMVFTKAVWIIIILIAIMIFFHKVILLGLFFASVFMALRSARYIIATKKMAGIKVLTLELVQMVLIDLVKKASLEYGKIYGMLKYRTLFI